MAEGLLDEDGGHVLTGQERAQGVLGHVHPRCTRLVTALGGGYAFRRLHGHITGEVEENAHAAIMEAFLGALATPVVTMTPGERARLMGPGT